nr:arylesterase [Aquabacterium sp.]
MFAGLGSWLGAVQAAGAEPPPAILILGDSLSAEYGLQRGSGWVALLTQRLARERIAAQVVNASISGETTSGGRARLPALLQRHRPSHVVIELGANDALRGLPLRSSRENLSAMVSAAQAQGAQVVLVGMQMPPNYGKRYAEDFAQLFQDVAKARKCALVPFFLRGVADREDARDWFQHDGIHPLEKAHPVMLDNVWGALKPLLLGRQART